MTLSWLFYTTLIGAAAAAGAGALVRLLRALELPTRGAWIGAMALTVLVPIVAYLRHGVVAPLAAPAGNAFLGPALATTWTITAGATDVPWLDTSLLVVWLICTCVLLVRLTGGMVRLRREAAEWPEREVDGVRVRVSQSVGPAVGGIRTTHVIVPRWLLDLDAPARALVLRHEEEHRLARDPLALVGATLLCALVPWNVALWWQASRLRLAVEMDCDARVLGRTKDVHNYGLLLLDIAQRGESGALTPTPALTEPASFLERRINAMTTRPSRHPIALATLGGLVLAAIAFACTAPAPTNAGNAPSPRVEPKPVSSGASTGSYFEFKIQKQAAIKPGQASPRYPDEMRQKGIEGEVLGQFVVDTTGHILPGSIKIVRATNEEFANAVRSALPVLEFTPAEVDGRKVRQLLTMPFSFSLSK